MSVQYHQCRHEKIRHSPDGISIIEECIECMTAWIIKPSVPSPITLGPTYTNRLIEQNTTNQKEN